LTELSQEAAVLPEVHPEHFWHREDVLAMGDRRQHVLGHPVAKLKDTLLVAGGAEVPALAGEGQEVFMAARITADPSEALRKIATREELLHNAPNDRPVEAVLILVPGGIYLLESGEVRLHALVEGQCLGVSWFVGPRDHRCPRGGGSMFEGSAKRELRVLALRGYKTLAHFRPRTTRFCL